MQNKMIITDKLVLYDKLFLDDLPVLHRSLVPGQVRQRGVPVLGALHRIHHVPRLHALDPRIRHLLSDHAAGKFPGCKWLDYINFMDPLSFLFLLLVRFKPLITVITFKYYGTLFLYCFRP